MDDITIKLTSVTCTFVISCSGQLYELLMLRLAVCDLLEDSIILESKDFASWLK